MDLNSNAETDTLAVTLIRAERQRQISVEGCTPDHDAEHGRGVLAKAAICYRQARWDWRWADWFWPWDAAGFKPRDRVSNLIRAGALYLAALEQPEPEGQPWAHERTDHLQASLDRVTAELEVTLRTARRLLQPGNTPDPQQNLTTPDPGDPWACGTCGGGRAAHAVGTVQHPWEPVIAPAPERAGGAS